MVRTRQQTKSSDQDHPPPEKVEKTSPLTKARAKAKKPPVSKDPSPSPHSLGGGNRQDVLAIPGPKGDIACITSHPPTDPPVLIFTHGASGNLQTPSLWNFGDGFGRSKPILLFQGSMNLKSRTSMFTSIIAYLKPTSSTPVTLGGRSMGARAAVMAALEDKTIKTLILASYPLTGQKGATRDQILLELDEGVDVLFISGSKDSMCDLDELREVMKKMKARTWLREVEGADHGMAVKPNKHTAAVGKITGRVAATWMDERESLSRDEVLTWAEEVEEDVKDKKTIDEKANDKKRAAESDQETPTNNDHAGGSKKKRRRKAR